MADTCGTQIVSQGADGSDQLVLHSSSLHQIIQCCLITDVLVTDLLGVFLPAARARKAGVMDHFMAATSYIVASIPPKTS